MSKGLVVALSGGVGGAKLALGLSRVLPADELLVIANTGDDFEHLGLKICPDIDTLTYVLAGLDNTEQGWGRRDETWSFMATIASVLQAASPESQALISPSSASAICSQPTSTQSGSRSRCRKPRRSQPTATAPSPR